MSGRVYCPECGTSYSATSGLSDAQCGVRLTGDTWCMGRLTSADGAIRSLARARDTAHAAGYESGIRERTRDMASFLDRAEKAEAELRAIEEQGGALREAAAAVRGDAERIRSLEADLTAARARIAELEAPLPEATITEIVDTFQQAERAYYRRNRFDHDAADRAGALAVAERVRRERCSIARAVAGGVDVTLYGYPGGGMWEVTAVARISSARTKTVPAAEVPAELARMLTEVGA